LRTIDQSFTPWRGLRALDLSSVGTLNFNGIETLQMMEELEPYQWSILPSQSNIQKASHELREFEQQHIPFHQNQFNLGEVINLTLTFH
jgi:hypothetical protein